MRRFKIVHVVHSLELGGLENGLVNLVNTLDPERFQHSIVCLTRAGSFAGRIGQDGVSIVELCGAGDNFRFPLMRLARLLRKLAPDVVHTRGWGAVDAVFAARCAGDARTITQLRADAFTDLLTGTPFALAPSVDPLTAEADTHPHADDGTPSSGGHRHHGDDARGGDDAPDGDGPGGGGPDGHGPRGGGPLDRGAGDLAG